MGNLTIFLEIAITIGGIAYITAQWQRGKAQSQKDVIEVLKKRGDTFEQALKDAAIETVKNHDEIIRLQEALKHAKEDNNRLLQILENRNPDLENTLKEINGTMKELKEFIIKK